MIRSWKYNSKKIECDWIVFRSKLEYNIYNYLKSENYKIEEHEPVFELQEKFEFEGKKYRSVIYKSDFLVRIDNVFLVIEVKWFETPEGKLKKKLFLYKLWDFEKYYECKMKLIVCNSLKGLKEELWG
jgi:hypothetical protein